MKWSNLLLIFGIFTSTCSCLDDEGSAQLKDNKKRLGDQIRVILKHYQQTNPVGLPGDFVPDPKSIPDITQTILVNEIHLTEINVYGISKFRIVELRTDFVMMQASITVAIDRLYVRGLYEQCVWYCSGSNNNFTIELSNITILGITKLQVGVDGKLYADDVDMDLNIETIDKYFENLDGLGSLIETLIDGTFIFDMMKPMILNEINTNVRGEVNKKLSRLPNHLPNSISPFDMAIVEAHQEARKMGYDPLKIDDQFQDLGMFTVVWSNMRITGLSNFYRVGNITLAMRNHTLFADLTITTREIEANTEWKLSVIGGFLSKTGNVSFNIEHLRVNIEISQSLDVREKLCLEKIDLDLGNIQTRVHDMTGTLDYVFEAAINIFPNLLRDQLMNEIEKPLKLRLQKELDKINVEELIDMNIPAIEKQAKKFEEIFADIDTDIETGI